MTLFDWLKTVHVLSIVLWVGGMAFVYFFLRPALAVLEPPARLRLMHEVLRRFLHAALAAATLALLSGLWMMGRVARHLVQAGAQFEWPLDWLLMGGGGLLMIVVLVFVRAVLFKRFAKAVSAEDWPAGGAALASIRAWVAFNLLLGIAVIASVLLI